MVFFLHMLVKACHLLLQVDVKIGWLHIDTGQYLCV